MHSIEIDKPTTPQKWVTLTTFNTPIEAAIVRNRLEAEGIRTCLSDEATLSMAWHLGTALGGIKLHVAQSDVERAGGILESKSDISMDDGDGCQREMSDNLDGDEVVDEIESTTDETVKRALRAALLGLMFSPLQLYSLWLLLQICFDESPISSRNRWLMFYTFLLNLPVIILTRIVVWAIFSDSFF